MAPHSEHDNGLYENFNGTSNGIGIPHEHSNGIPLGSPNEYGNQWDPIAIVGMGMRLPGGIHTADELWQLLTNKKTTRCEIPEDRFSVSGFHSPSGKVGSVAMRHGHFLADTDDPRYLDTSFFSMSRNEVETLDPQQRMLLEVVYECMQTAGQVEWRGKNVGCYVGVWGEDWLDIHAKDSQDAGVYRVPGGHDFAISNRISYEYDLSGPSFTIKAGCSSSLIALHEAVRAIQAGDCSSAIVAGTNLILSPTMSMAMTEQHVLSPDASCKTFDAAANGYARGEAINAIYIKRLSDAVRDNDSIRSIIRATSSNCDGRTPGMSMPSSEAHESLIRKAYKEAGCEPYGTAFVEAHGTGTPTGDPIEATAIANVFRGKGEFYIGSVKPHLGHSEGASGITSVIKATLVLENKIIPPNINFVSPNPKIPFQAARMIVPVETTSWPKEKACRASVNSFGIGGANAHAILESSESICLHRSGSNGTRLHSNGYTNGSKSNGHFPRRKFLHVLSATNAESLKQTVLEHQRYMENNISKMSDISYTLCNRREHLSNRVYCVADNFGEIKFSQLTKAKTKPEITMMFTGQGAQWAGMAKELMDDYPSFRDDIENLSHVLSKLEHRPAWDITDELKKTASISNVAKAVYAQPLVTAVQVGLVNLLHAWGIVPSAVLGHSSGEIAAAYAAGAITAEEAITIAYYRGQVTTSSTQQGGMAAIGLGREQVSEYLMHGVTIACENSPSNVTLSGDKTILTAVCEHIRSDLPDILVRELQVEVAYHSHHMQEIGADYAALLHDRIDSKAPVVPFFSSVKAKQLKGKSQLNAAYWRENLESPVLFKQAVDLLLKSRPSEQLFLEIGPHKALAGPLRQILKSSNRSKDNYLTALERGEDCTESLLKMAGDLYLHRIPVNFMKISPPGALLTNLPLYHWRHEEKYWAESRATRDWRCRRFPHHELLGIRTMESTDLQPDWRNVLRLEEVPWLRDHQVINDIVFPCAGYLGMAQEAIRQIASAEECTLRDVVVQTALVITDSKAVELITSLRPVRLTDTLNSVWWEFCVSSYNGTVWLKHCCGQIRPGTDQPFLQPNIQSHPRSVAPVYSAFRKLGLEYGPSFQGLHQVSVLPKKKTAFGKLHDPKASESAYAVHPTTIDHCLQLFFVANCEGEFRNAGTLCVPTSIEQVYLCRRTSNDTMLAEAAASSNAAGIISGDATAVCGEIVILSVAGAKFSPLEDNLENETVDTIAAAALEWRPDIEFLDIASLIRSANTPVEDIDLTEKLTLLAIIEISHRTSLDTAAAPHLQNFRSWIDSQVARALRNKYDLVSDADSLLALDAEARSVLLTELRGVVSRTGAKAVGELIGRIVDRCEDIVQGQVEGIEVLLPENGLTNFYDFMEPRTDCVDFFAAVGHSKPNLRVLEIGAGTGGTTAVVLKGLTSATSGQRTYSTYVYTDISSGFFVTAQERFKQHQGLEYKVLDITKDPIEQGFEAESYDIIVAANVLHATPNLQATLSNVRKLIAPSGYLFLQELAPQAQMGNLVMGILPGWWLGKDDGRVYEPYIKPERWDRELKMAGLSGADAAIYDAALPHQLNANIISRPQRKEASTERVTLLHRQDLDTLWMEEVRDSLLKCGFQTDLCPFGQMPATGQSVVSLLEVENPIFEGISEDDLSSMQQIVRSLGKSKLLWVMRQGQVNSTVPGFGLTLGLTRCLRSELLLDAATLELDTLGQNSCTAIAQVFRKFREVESDSELRRNHEFVLSGGFINIGRYHPVSVPQQLAIRDTAPGAVKLEIGRYGLLQTLRWVPHEAAAPGSGDVVIEPRCAGLNFRDVLLSMGIVDAGGLGIGLEGSGLIAAVGSDVKNVQVGDRVMYLGQNCFSSRMTISAKRCVKIPSNLSWEEAATMPCVYATAIHALLDVGKIEKDQTVLIHSACGAVGLAAIQICRSIGLVQIYMTVGSEEKAQYLVKTFGVSRENIFNSRDTSFLPAIKAATNGRGVDLVLNSLSGELLHASWRCVAAYGKMVEIGKRDFRGKAQLRMDIFEANRAFCGVDLATFDGDRCQPLLVRTVQLFKAGSIKPIVPMTLFPGTQVEDSFRYMQKGIHIGKIVVQIPAGAEGLPVAQVVPELQLNPEVSYLLVGGLGGLGRAVATWLVERGVRNLIFLSRSAGNSDSDQEFFNVLSCLGCSVQAFAASVTNISDVENVVKMASRPIKGVFQMSMVLRDKNFLDMDISDWETAVKPKVNGTWNLHRAMPKDLDFFITTASISGTFGNPGQANYAAANTFLGAFVQYRRSLGLPASVVDIGVMEDVGWVSQNSSVAESIRAGGGYFIHEQDLLDSLHWAIIKSPATQPDGHLTIGVRSGKPLSDPSNRILWKTDPRMALYHNLDTSLSVGISTTSDRLKSFMSLVETNPLVLEQTDSLELVTNEIGIRIYAFMMQPAEELNVSQTLASLGVDSLVTIEIRNWMKRSLGGVEFSTLEILNAGTIEALGVLAIEALKKKYALKIKENRDAYLLFKAP